MKVFITGIGTGVGKTIVSAVLTEALKAGYWKPVQAGELDNSDTMVVKSLVSNAISVYYEEAHRLLNPLSPHAAAALERVNISVPGILDKYRSITADNLVVEGAGGILVPLSRKELMIDLIEKMDIPVVLVSRHYLGSINHTLLSVEILKNRNIPIKGIVFNGTNKTSEDFILQYTGLDCIARIHDEPKLDKEKIREYASKIKLR